MKNTSCTNIASGKVIGVSEKLYAQGEIGKPFKTKCKIWNDDCLSRMKKLQDSCVDFWFIRKKCA